MRRALITGITGQDGSYLAELLLEKGYQVHGLIRRSSSFNTDRIDHIFRDPHDEGGRLRLHHGDLTDSGLLHSLVAEIAPHEVYHLGAQSHVRVSFDIPEYTAEVTGLGTLRMLEAVRKHAPGARLYQAGSSEMFGSVREVPQRETTPFLPASPYGVAKVFAHWAAVNYRQSHGLFVCNGILFNHESPRRGGTFLTRKTTRAIASMVAGKQDKLYLGNLEARRDWGYAPEYVDAMWRMLQRDAPDDFVVATGETHTVREFVEAAFRHAGMDLRWEGKGVGEKGVERATGRVRVEIDPRYFRPTEVDLLQGDAGKAAALLGFRPRVTFQELVRLMVEEDIRAVREHTDYRFR
jgi:GDPmannose 4,6-dehydratase